MVVVDDGSTDESGRIADQYAARDGRVRVVHTANARPRGGAQRGGVGTPVASCIAFCDSDDVVPPGTYAMLAATLGVTGSDFVTGSIVRWETDGLWSSRRGCAGCTRRLAQAIGVDQHPEILGDVFAWNKLFRRSFWEGRQLSWPEGCATRTSRRPRRPSSPAAST